MEDYLTYDDILAISVGQIKTDLEDWRKTGREEAITFNVFSENGVIKNKNNKRMIRQTATTEAFAMLINCFLVPKISSLYLKQLKKN